ncbi:hydroxymethylglutaryl-CoA lyase [Angustibacter speluncae]
MLSAMTAIPPTGTAPDTPSLVEVVEVSPRDGLQNEATPVSTEDKLALLDRLVATGVRRVEAVSFAHPRAVPQMADAEAVAASFPTREVSWIGLVLNERGLDRAVAAGVDEVNVVVLASETFSRRNQNASVDEAVEAWLRIAPRAREAGLRTTVTVGAAFGCPFEGEVPVRRVREVLRRCVEGDPDEVALADTVGVGVPVQVEELAAVALEQAPDARLRWHFHDTRSTGYANAWEAVRIALATGRPTALDASAGGIGGCPFAPAATGNIATEDLAYLLERSGVRTGLRPDALLPLGEWLSDLLGHRVPGQLGRAGWFPAAVGAAHDGATSTAEEGAPGAEVRA